MDLIKILLLLAVIVIVYYLWINHWFIEPMAPLGTGTFPNNYPRGGCNPGRFNRTSCEIGTCPLESTISNTEYCAIQCAQDPDEKIRNQCFQQCIEMMDNGCR